MTADASPDLREVRLIGLPVQLWAAAKEHNDELLREFALIAAGAQEGSADADMPSRLVTLMDVLRQQYGDSERDAMLFAAAADGVQSMDLVLTLPVRSAEAVEVLGGILDEADDYCRQGEHLLTLSTPAELVALRRWYLGQVVGQLRGAEPTPWSGTA